MTKSLARVEQEQIILDALQSDPSTLAGLANTTGLQYYTIRRAVNDFLREGVVKIIGSSEKHRIYAYNVASKRTEDRIPRLMDIVQKTSSKAIYILAAVGNEDSMKIVQAARNLPRHVASLMHVANIASHGQDVNYRLDSIRDQMQREYLYAKSCASMYEQILQEPRFWEPKHLRTMVDDPDYVYPEVQKAMDYYEQA